MTTTSESVPFGGAEPRAIRHVGQILFQSGAVAKQPMLVPSLVSIGLSAMASELVMDLAPNLRITTNEPGAATPQQVHELIARLLDESTVDESRWRHLMASIFMPSRDRAVQTQYRARVKYSALPMFRLTMVVTTDNVTRNGRQAPT